MNGYDPMSRLPTETVSYIFGFVQKRFNDKDQSNVKEFKWFNITHVCAAWRDIAISTQTLWNYISTGSHSSVDQTNTYIQRSGTSPLIVHHRSQAEQAIECLQLALSHISRISELEIFDFRNVEDPILAGLLANPAPIMKNFLYHSLSWLDGSGLLAGEAPRLEHLSLYFCSIQSWSSIPIMRGLKYLKFGSNQSPATLQQIISILAVNTELEMLNIKGRSNSSPSDFTPPLEEPIRLTSLGYINTTEIDVKLLLKLFENVRFSANVDYYISCCADPSEDPTGVIPAALNRKKPCNSLYLSIDTNSVQIITDPLRHRYRVLWRNFTENNKLVYHWKDSVGNIYNSFVEPDHTLRSICSVIRNRYWSTATELRVEFRGDDIDLTKLTSALWVEFLCLLPRLQKISIEAAATRENQLTVVKDLHKGFLETLATASVAYNGEINQYSCPNLVDLCLCGYDFEVGLPSLVESLSRRSEYGLRLRRFEARDPFGSTDLTLNILEQSGIANEVKLTQRADWRDGR